LPLAFPIIQRDAVYRVSPMLTAGSEHPDPGFRDRWPGTIGAAS